MYGKMGFSVLCSKTEDVEYDLPARSDEFGLLVAKSCDAHHDVFFDFFLSGGQIVQHDRLEGFQEHLLVAEVLALFLFQEFRGKLSKRVDRISHNMEIFVRANPGEVLSKGAPDALPLEPYSVHV